MGGGDFGVEEMTFDGDNDEMDEDMAGMDVEWLDDGVLVFGSTSISGSCDSAERSTSGAGGF